jgi:hypothetical protein
MMIPFLWMALLAQTSTPSNSPVKTAGAVNVLPRLSQTTPLPATAVPEEVNGDLLRVHRVYVDRLTGGETAAQMRDLIISSLQGSKLFVITESEERADTLLRGAAEDLVYTDQYQSSEGVNIHAGDGGSNSNSSGTRFNGAGGSVSRSASRNIQLTLGENEETNIKERRHEALATVRLVNKDGDVIWSTTQESTGAKYRGASADVAEKITRALMLEYERARKKN